MALWFSNELACSPHVWPFYWKTHTKLPKACKIKVQLLPSLARCGNPRRTCGPIASKPTQQPKDHILGLMVPSNLIIFNWHHPVFPTVFPWLLVESNSCWPKPFPHFIPGICLRFFTSYNHIQYLGIRNMLSCKSASLGCERQQVSSWHCLVSRDSHGGLWSSLV